MLTEREKWLMHRAYTAGFDQGATKLRNWTVRSFEEWIGTDTIHGLVVEKWLADNAPEGNDEPNGK